MKPSISIVTCSYQQARYLEATIRSVVSQGYRPLEYLVIDGGSRDGSRQIIERHSSELHYWVSESDKGQSDALIKGFDRSTGDVMGWLCSDDLLLPGALAKVGDFFSRHPEISVVYGNALWIDAAGNFIRAKAEPGFNRLAFTYDHNYIPQPSMFWRRSLYEAVGGLNVKFHLAMDSDLWQRFSQKAKIAHIPDFLSCMRFYPEQKTRSLAPEKLAEDIELRSRSNIGSGFDPRVLRMVGRAVRIWTKMMSGGYTAKPGSDILAALEQYKITS